MSSFSHDDVTEESKRNKCHWNEDYFKQNIYK